MCVPTPSTPTPSSFIECLPCAGHSAEPPQPSLAGRQGFYSHFIIPIIQKEKQSAQKRSGTVEIALLVSGRAGTWAQA